MLLLSVVIIILIVLYYFTTKNHDYWSKRNVKHDPPIPIFGNHFRNVFCIKAISKIAEELYNKYPDEKVVGYYRGRTPELIIRDPDIAKHILNLDFNHFYVRGLGRDTELESLLLNLFNTEGDSWKLLRQQMTSTFTTAKLKNMFPLIVKCTNKLKLAGEHIAGHGGDCDVRELMARFTTEFIGACAFGIEMDSISNEECLFRKFGQDIFTPTIKDLVLFGLTEIFPELSRYIQVIDDDIENRITEIVQGIREQRNFKPSGRNDFIDLLLELESKGIIKGTSIEKVNKDGSPVEVEMKMDLKCVVAQVFVFFIAGFETSSSSTSFTLHQLAFHPEIQSKIQEEIDRVLSKYDNKLCYDAILEMKLLEMAFREGLRMFPSLGDLNRVCTKKYTIPETNVTIDKGVKILIPLQALQNDEKYFDNPKEFRPERFLPDQVHTRHKYVYMPFGEGPRACIGARMGLMQSLAGLATVLHNFTVEPAASTHRELEVDNSQNVIQRVVGGLPLRLKVRNNSK